MSKENNVETGVNQPTTPKKDRVQKNPRINLAFYADNLDYVQDAAWQDRMSVTSYINRLIAEDRIRRAEEEKERRSKVEQG